MQRFAKIFELYSSVHHQCQNEGKEKIQGRRRGGKVEEAKEEAVSEMSFNLITISFLLSNNKHSQSKSEMLHG